MRRSDFRLNIRSPWVYLPLLFVLVTGFGTSWFLHNFEKKEFTYRRGISPAAMRNQLLAAEMFLNKRGIRTISRKGMNMLHTLPSPNDILLARRMPAMLSERMSDTILAWVEQGGHLLLVPPRSESDHPGATSLLKKFNISVNYSEESFKGEATDGNSETAEEVDQQAHRDEPHDNLMEFTIEQVPLQVSIYGYSLLKDMDGDADYRISGIHRKISTGDDNQDHGDLPTSIERDGSWLLQYTIGRGRITLLSELTPFTNRNIGRYDHASVLEWLVQDARNVWILYAIHARSLPEIIQIELPRFCFAAAILLLLILWKIQRRGGTIRRPHDQGQPNVTAHIVAVGNYDWRHDRLKAMVKENRNALLARLTGRYLGPLSGQHADKHDLASLARKSGLAPATLKVAFGQDSETEHDLILVSKAMQNIEAQLQAKEKANEKSNG